MSLVNFLNRYNQIQVLPDTEKSTPFHSEITLRVMDNTFWTNCLEILTRAFPQVYFIKRYITKDSKFGFQWLLILWGQRDEEQLNQFCDEADAVIGTPSIKTIPKIEVQANKNDSKFLLKTSKILNDEGKEIGETRRIKLAGTAVDENSLNEMNHKDAPMVFKGSLEGMTSQILRRLGK